MSMYNVVFYCWLCLISQTSASTDLTDTYILCEKQNRPSLECPATTYIMIKDAIYGRTNRSVCNRISSKSTSCKVTVTRIVEIKCNSFQTCLPEASNKIYGDPCKGIYKYLNVTYRCIKDVRLSSNSSTHLPTLFFTASLSSSSTTKQQESFSTTDDQQALKSSTHLPTQFFTASPSSSSKTEQQESFATNDAQPSLKSSTHLPTQFFTASPSSSSKTEQQVTFSLIGLAIGISASVAVIIIIACVLIILRKRKRSPEKQSTQTYANEQDYNETQNIAMPRSGDSPEYNDLKVHHESHKYGELKSRSKPSGNTFYDYIDAKEHTRETNVFSVEQGIFQNDLSSRSCQEYAMLDPSEKWKTELNKSSYHDTGCDYTVLEAEEARINHPVYPPSDQFDKRLNTYKTKNNAKTLEVKSVHNATREDYVVLDPKLTGFNRMNDTSNNKLLKKRAIFNPNIREMDHNKTHPLKEDTKYYELAKPLDEDRKENTCHKYDGEYGFCQDSDYNQLNSGHPTYSEEHVYNHTVDDVYDTTSHNKKCTTPDNTYDYFCGDKTDDDYNIPMKM